MDTFEYIMSHLTGYKSPNVPVIQGTSPRLEEIRRFWSNVTLQDNYYSPTVYLEDDDAAGGKYDYHNGVKFIYPKESAALGNGKGYPNTYEDIPLVYLGGASLADTGEHKETLPLTNLMDTNRKIDVYLPTENERGGFHLWAFRGGAVPYLIMTEGFRLETSSQYEVGIEYIVHSLTATGCASFYPDHYITYATIEGVNKC